MIIIGVFLALLVCWLSTAIYATPPSADFGGHGKAWQGGSESSNTASVTVTTTSPADEAILFVHTVDTTTVITHVSAVTGCGLTWAKRFARTQTDAAGGKWGSPLRYEDSELWWGYASSALSACTITATLTNSVDNTDLMMWGVNGVANTAAPWDGNTSLTAFRGNSASSDVIEQVNGITANSSDDFVFALSGQTTNGVPSQSGAETIWNTQSVSAGGLGFSNCTPACAVGFNWVWGEYKRTNLCSQAKNLTGFAVAPTDAQLANPGWMMIGDAMVGVGSTSCVTPPPPFPQVEIDE